MKIKQVAYYYSAGVPTLTAQIETVMPDGKTWTLYSGLYGSKAEELWNSWGTNNEDEIIKKLIESAK